MAIRIKLAIFFFIAAFVALLCRLYHIQINRHDELYAKAKNQYTAVVTSKGKRGEIYDCHGNLLVGNIPCTNITADPQYFKTDAQRKAVADYFAKRLHLDYDTILRRISRRTYTTTNKDGQQETRKLHYALIAKKVDYRLAEKIKKEVEFHKYSGIFFQENNQRYYPKNELLANILGFTSIDRDKVIAVIGIEKFIDKQVSPSVTKSYYERARNGRKLPYEHTKIKKVKDGLNVYLTIREPVQAIMEEELDKLMKKWEPKAAYAVMVDPYTGNIMAMAQRPTFNPNDRGNMRPQAWRNRIIEDVFEPGSTIKPIAIAGALDNDVVSPDTKFDCGHGSWFYAGKILHDAHPMDILTVFQIVKKSSNIGTAKIALLLGEKRLYQILRKFGIGQHTGIPLKPESRGIFRKLKNWDSLSITRFPIGQGLALSPLQLVRAYCALANGGTLVNLRLIDRLASPDSGKVIKNPYKLGTRIFKKRKTCRQIVDMMKSVTKKGGTATKAAIPGYEVAGKTGTSQKVINREYSHKYYFASFIGFVPADNPAFVLLVTLDEPKRKHYGGTVAAPTFRRISERTLRYMNVPPSDKRYQYANR